MKYEGTKKKTFINKNEIIVGTDPSLTIVDETS